MLLSARGGRTDSPAAITITYTGRRGASLLFAIVQSNITPMMVKHTNEHMYNGEFVYRYIALTKMFICAAWNENYIIFFKFYCYFFIFLLSRLLSYTVAIYIQHYNHTAQIVYKTTRQHMYKSEPLTDW